MVGIKLKNRCSGGCRLMDTVYIKGLRAEAVIGVYDWERDIRQTLVLDLENLLPLPDEEYKAMLDKFNKFSTE